MEIEHFLHDHPLLLTQTDDQKYLCNGCQEVLSDSIYVCNQCGFYLHKACAELPQEIQHFFHPCLLTLKISSSEGFRCDACFQDVSGLSFRCQRCDFDLDVRCAQLPTIKSDGKKQIQHLSHRHPLMICEKGDGDKALCAVCRKLCSGPTFGCNQCKFVLHESCVDIPHKINHFFHRCPLTLISIPYYHCGGCDQVRSGLTFRCSKCCFHLDVECALLPTIESEGAEKIQHISHEHPLQLTEKEDGYEFHCRACGESCFSPAAYGCSRCEYFVLHKSCAELPREIQHPFHPRHPLTIFTKPPNDRSVFCWGCGYKIWYFCYHCPECNFYLDLNCKSLKPSVKYEGHKHLLTFFESTASRSKCSTCDKWCKGCILRCVQCSFNLHLKCNPSVPPTIKYERHFHRLAFTTSVVQADPDVEAVHSDDEFYCDACEKKRNPKDPVYYCEQCDYAAHIRCVSSEVFPPVSGEDICANEDPNLARLDQDIAELSAEVEPIEEETKELIAKRKQLEEEREALEALLKQLTVDIDAVTADIDALTAKTERLTTKIEVLNAERAEYLAPASKDDGDSSH